MPYGMQQGWPLVLVQGPQQVYEYQMNPNASVFFLSMNENIFWVKNCDGMGKCDVSTFDFTKRDDAEDEGFATKADMSALNSKLDQLLGEFR